MSKTKILEEFWFGNLRPFEQVKPIDFVLTEKAIAVRNTLFSTLSTEQKECFETYEASFDIVGMESTKEAFIKGFRLGVKFLLATLDE